MPNPLKLGFFIQPVHPPFRPYADVLREDREAVVLADRLGYREAFIGEHLVDAAAELRVVDHLAQHAAQGLVELGGRAREALAQVGLADRADHFPSQLSGGQQQRVAIARALVNQPRMLLADEPTGNLDSRTSVEVMEIFQKLNAEGLTIILVTHEPDIAQFAKREIVFRDGQIKRDDVVEIPQVASEALKTMPTIED